MKRKKRKPRRVREDNEPMTSEALLIHRELQYLRAEGLTRNRKPGTAERIHGRSGGKPNHSWVEERWDKLQQSRREVAAGRRNEGLGGGSAATL